MQVFAKENVWGIDRQYKHHSVTSQSNLLTIDCVSVGETVMDGNLHSFVTAFDIPVDIIVVIGMVE